MRQVKAVAPPDPNEALDALSWMDPGALNQNEWVRASMAAKAAGVGYTEWDAWNQRDPGRYDERENGKRWDSFDPEKSGGISKNTLFGMARDRGWRGGDTGAAARAGHHEPLEAPGGCGTMRPPRLSLDDAEAVPLPSLEEARRVPANEQLSRYMRALHGPDAHVAVVTDSVARNGGKPRPNGRGELYRAGDLIDHPEEAMGKANPTAGAWVAVNEYDPERFAKDGRRGEALSSFSYALIEADEDEDGEPIPPEEQMRMAARLRLPVRAVVWSGAKSLHLACAVDARDAGEFRRRAAFMTGTCTANGFHVDTSVKDPVRLSRLPGVMREGQQQTLIWACGGPDEGESNGCFTASWAEWLAFVEAHREEAPADSCTKGMPTTGGTVSEEQGKGTISRAIARLHKVNSPLAECIGFDTLRNDVVVRHPERLPWRHRGGPSWTESDSAHATQYLQDLNGGKFAKCNLDEVLLIVAGENEFNPFLERIESVEWDGFGYAEHLFHWYLGAEDTPYTREVCKLFLRQIVVRVTHPGAQCDNTPVLKSNVEGIGKTTFCRALAFDEDAFYVSLPSIRDPKTAGENMRGKVICELEEATALRAVSPDEAKAFLTARTDTYRPAYGKRSEDHPRTACTIITCNSTGWMDSIGQDRRYMPIECGVDPNHLPLGCGDGRAREELSRYVAQAFAQTYHDLREYKSQHDTLPPLILPPEAREQWEAARDSAQAVDEEQDAILDYLNVEAEKGTEAVTATMILRDALGMSPSDATRDRKAQRRVREIVDRKAPDWVWSRHKVPVTIDKVTQSRRAFVYVGRRPTRQ